MILCGRVPAFVFVLHSPSLRRIIIAITKSKNYLLFSRSFQLQQGRYVSSCLCSTRTRPNRCYRLHRHLRSIDMDDMEHELSYEYMFHLINTTLNIISIFIGQMNGPAATNACSDRLGDHHTMQNSKTHLAHVHDYSVFSPFNAFSILQLVGALCVYIVSTVCTQMICISFAVRAAIQHEIFKFFAPFFHVSHSFHFHRSCL